MFVQELVPVDDPILQLENVMVTPHMSSHNRDALVVETRAVYANFQPVLRGEAPIDVARAYAEAVTA